MSDCKYDVLEEQYAEVESHSVLAREWVCFTFGGQGHWKQKQSSRQIWDVSRK